MPVGCKRLFFSFRFENYLQYILRYKSYNIKNWHVYLKVEKLPLVVFNQLLLLYTVSKIISTIPALVHISGLFHYSPFLSFSPPFCFPDFSFCFDFGPSLSFDRVNLLRRSEGSLWGQQVMLTPVQSLSPVLGVIHCRLRFALLLLSSAAFLLWVKRWSL